MKVGLKYLNHLLALLTLLTIQRHTYAQASAISYRAFDTIKLALCNNDVARATRLLEDFERAYGNEELTAFSDKILGDLYMKANRTDAARQKYLRAFNTTLRRGSDVLGFRDTACNRVLNKYFYSYRKADICVPLSFAYRKLGRMDSSLYYLKLADEQLNPYRGCGNGAAMYSSYLTPFFTDYYLAAKDTTAAINRLLNFLWCPDGNTRQITEKLKATLALKYSKEQVVAEVNTAINTLTLKPDSPAYTDVYIATITLFGHKIYSHTAYKTATEYKAMIRKSVEFKSLLQ